MIDKFLRFIYWKYKDRIHDLVVEDFYGNIPRETSSQALYIVKERRQKVESWLYYQVYHLSRRIPKDKEGNEKVFGMLLQLKLMLAMIAKGTDYHQEEQESKIEDTKSEKDISAEQLDRELEGVDKFKKGSK